MALRTDGHSYDEKREGGSREGENVHVGRLNSFEARAMAIDSASLDFQETITRDVLVLVTSTEAADVEMRSAELAVNPAIGFHRNLPVETPHYPIVEPEHAAALVRKYAAIGTYIDQATQRLREGVARGHTPTDKHAAETAAQVSEYLETPLEKDDLLNARVPEAFDEQATLTELLKRMTELAKAKNRTNPTTAARTSVVHTILNHNDFITIR